MNFLSLSYVYQTLSDSLRGGGIENPAQEARILIEARGGFTWADIIARPETILPRSCVSLLERDVERRLGGMPLSRILGEREFYGLSFALGAGTLDPRPDTETIIDAALSAFASDPPARILDLGTGSGCLLVTLLHQWNRAWGVGVDLSFPALCVARANAIRHGVSDRAAFIQGNWAESLAGSFDLMVSNPPYIPNQEIKTLSKEVQNHDPILALDGGEDGLDAYRIVIPGIKNRLTPRGRAFVEIGFGQALDVARLVEKSGLVPSRIHADLAGVERVFEIRRGDK